MRKNTDKLNMTAHEWNAFCNECDALSDVQELFTDSDGRVWKPALEWDGPYGRHWTRFETMEELQAALDRYDLSIARWLVEYRTRSIREAIEKGKRIAAKRRAERELRTLGGNFPVLKQLLVETRKSLANGK